MDIVRYGSCDTRVPYQVFLIKLPWNIDAYNISSNLAFLKDTNIYKLTKTICNFGNQLNYLTVFCYLSWLTLKTFPLCVFFFCESKVLSRRSLSKITITNPPKLNGVTFFVEWHGAENLGINSVTRRFDAGCPSRNRDTKWRLAFPNYFHLWWIVRRYCSLIASGTFTTKNPVANSINSKVKSMWVTSGGNI